MKNSHIIIIFSLLSFINQLHASTYYFSSSTGSDSYISEQAKNQKTPWQTLGKLYVVMGTLQPGDSVLFKRGDTFAANIKITVSGSDGLPITFGAYGTGANPVITGFTTITAWTNLGGNIWESTNAVSALSACNMVAVNGINTARGRYPNSNAANSGYLTFQSHSGNTSITSSSLTGTPDWTGAEVVIRPVRWILNRATISSNSGSKLIFSPATSYEPLNGFGFFIQNDSRTLDIQNEWYYNPSTNKLSIYSTSQPTDVKLATIEDLITITASYITVQDLTVTGANDNAITGNSTLRSNIIIKDCIMTLCGGTVLSGIKCDDFLIDGNVVSNSNNNGISGDVGDRVTITNNNVNNIGIYAGMGTLIYAGISTAENSNVLIKNNSVTNVGYIGISFYSDYITIENNYIDTYCKVLDDGGGIYTYTGTRAAMTNVLVAGNIVLNGIGAINGSSGNMTSTAIGIYLDINSKNVEVSYNTIAYTATYGMLMLNPSYVNVHHNTFYDNTPQLRITGGAATNNNIIITNNTFVVGTSTQGLLTFIAPEENLNLFGTVDYNHYRLISSLTNLFWTSQPSSPYVFRSYTSWQSYLNKDLNSEMKLITEKDGLLFEYNATKVAKTITLDSKYVSVDNKIYNGSVTLQPYSSVVLMKYNGNLEPSIFNQSFNMPEDRTNGTIIGTVVASDPDTDQTLIYSILSGNTNGGFAINASTGVITVANVTALAPNSALVVKVQDNGAGNLSRQATITIGSIVTGIREIDNNNSFKLYPNPAYDKAYITGGVGLIPATATLYDLSGRVIRQETVSEGSPIEIGSLTKGIYAVRISVNKQTQTLKLIKR